MNTNLHKSEIGKAGKAETVKDQMPMESFGRVAWNAYRVAVGGKSLNGESLPTWEEMFADSSKSKLVSAWIEAARAVLHLHTLNEKQKTIAAGYAGILPSGHIVDRRVYSTAIPIPENDHLGVPKPKFLNRKESA